MVGELGAGPDDVSLAIANEGTPASRFTVAALRVVRTSAADMLAIYRATTTDVGPAGRATEVTVTSRPVVRIDRTDDPTATTFIYALRDKLYVVQASPELAETLLPLLP